MAKPNEDAAALTDVQLEIMSVVWTRGKVTVAEVWRAVSTGRKLARNTVQTMMTRLEDKGWLKHEQRGNAFHYQANRQRSATQRSMVQRLINGAFEGSAEGLVMTLLENRQLDADEIKRIRKLLDEQKPKEK